MSYVETLCITFHNTFVNQNLARNICRNDQSELISFHRRDVIPQLYNVTHGYPLPGETRTIFWTGARVVTTTARK
jgi:hypothetical protein